MKKSTGILWGTALTLSLIGGWFLSPSYADEIGSTRAEIPAYARKNWSHWSDSDKDCRDTRQEVLLAESLVPPIMSKNGCKVLAGLWRDPYTGKMWADPGQLDVDHTIPLKLAAISGGAEWDTKKKRDYANYLKDPDHLIAIHLGINRSKGGKSIDQWHPVGAEHRCWYAHVYLKIKRQWDLSWTEPEVEQLNQELYHCADRWVLTPDQLKDILKVGQGEGE
jgi:hypothetical protein